MKTIKSGDKKALDKLKDYQDSFDKSSDSKPKPDKNKPSEAP